MIAGVAAEAIHIRSGPSVKHNIVGQIEKDAPVYVADVEKKWAKVHYGFLNSERGYVSLSDIQFHMKSDE